MQKENDYIENPFKGKWFDRPCIHPIHCLFMKAIRFHRHGGPEVLQLDDLAEPRCAPGEVLLEVKAAGINHLDIWLRKGLPGLSISLPHIPGSDASGILRETGKDVTTVMAGTRVLLNPGISCGECEFCSQGEESLCVTYSIYGETRDGTYTQYLCVPAESVIPIPDGIGFEEAAAVPLVFLTAWRMMITRGRIKSGEDVLIHAIGSGVSTACLQIAKLIGARAIVTAGTQEKIERAKALGADISINYREEDFVKRIREITHKRGVDLVIDHVGKETWTKSLRCLRRGGRLVTCGSTTGYDPPEDIRHIFFRQLEILGSTMGSRKELMEVLRHIFAGRLKGVVDRVLPLHEAAEAHRLIEGRMIFGKIILMP